MTIPPAPPLPEPQKMHLKNGDQEQADRGALFSDIRKGKKLRSVPKPKEKSLLIRGNTVEDNAVNRSFPGLKSKDFVLSQIQLELRNTLIRRRISREPNSPAKDSKSVIVPDKIPLILNKVGLTSSVKKIRPQISYEDKPRSPTIEITIPTLNRKNSLHSKPSLKTKPMVPVKVITPPIISGDKVYSPEVLLDTKKPSVKSKPTLSPKIFNTQFSAQKKLITPNADNDGAKEITIRPVTLPRPGSKSSPVSPLLLPQSEPKTPTKGLKMRHPGRNFNITRTRSYEPKKNVHVNNGLNGTTFLTKPDEKPIQVHKLKRTQSSPSLRVSMIIEKLTSATKHDEKRPPNSISKPSPSKCRQKIKGVDDRIHLFNSMNPSLPSFYR